MPASTLADATNQARARLPRLATVRAFVTACGAATQLSTWEAAWRVVRHGERGDGGRPVALPARPCQLPRTVRHFVGREELLERLDQVGAARDGHWAPVVAISGPAGAGKTALAIRWARRVATSYPDGQLYLDLLASSQRAGLTSHDALGLLLGGLGVSRSALPDEYAARLGLYRSLTQALRLLVVLDDARSAEQARALLPAGPACLGLVSSRDPLAELVAVEDAIPMAVGPLRPAEAEQLLALLLGWGRTRREGEATSELVRRCGYLPLPVRAAAAALLASPELRLASYLRQPHAASLGAPVGAAGPAGP